MRKLTVPGIAIVIVSLLIISLPVQGCASPDTGGFAIFLTENNIDPAEMTSLDNIQLADTPLISLKDIVTYNMQAHELKLTAGAFERICDLEIPVRGKTFIVCRDRIPVYRGAFWTPVSSISYSGVTIWKPYGKYLPKILTLDLGYPSSSFYSGQDPRNDPELMNSLELTGKLVKELTVGTVKELPGSMKGYELYSWQQNGDWHFTLITGTNRNKSIDEIMSGTDFISEAGFVKIQMTGADALKSVLDKIPKGVQVIWLPYSAGGQSSQSANFSLPPRQTLNMIIDYARQQGIDIQATPAP
jgi:hypothetical protein